VDQREKDNNGRDKYEKGVEKYAPAGRFHPPGMLK
jgi:hypothetical protein